MVGRVLNEALRRLRTVLAAVVATAVAVSGCAAGGVPALNPARLISLEGAQIRVAEGMLRGVVGADYRRFEGIPYAAAARWQPPGPPARWPGIRDADRPGRWCVQDVGSAAATAKLTGEDCLTLNVWTPTGVRPELRPVLVWIHGGGFVRGSGDIYGARRLAARGDIVVVTINYRLGALGFLADPALGAADSVGNYGLADQQVALRWVRDNIASFGGDPAKVTIAGESAGAMAVCDHLVAPGSAGLFRAAIIQSGPCQAQVDLATAERISRDYTAAVGCRQRDHAAACLRALPAAALAGPLFYTRFGTDQLGGPVTGTHTLPADPIRAFAAGRAARVPVLIGVNRDEFTMFVALRYLRDGRELSAADYPGVLSDTFGAADSAAIAAQYPPRRFHDSVSLAYAAAATDDVFACVADRIAHDLAGIAPAVYAYQFDDRHAPAPELYQQAPFPVGASHSLELRYLFDVGGAPALDAAQRRLSDRMIDYWSRFVTTGAPQVPEAPDWPPLAGGWMSLRPDGSRVISDFPTQHQCGFWARLRR